MKYIQLNPEDGAKARNDWFSLFGKENGDDFEVNAFDPIVPDGQIWYRTSNNQKIDAFGSDQTYVTEGTLFGGGMWIAKYGSTIPSISYDSYLTEIYYPNSLNVVTKFDNTFLYYCSNLRKIKFPTNIKLLQGTSASRGYGYCTSLLSVVIPDSVESINSPLFPNCSKLSYVKLSNNLKSISGYSESYGCFVSTSISNILLPEKLETIGRYAFYGAQKLLEIFIPKNVSIINTYAFGYTPSLGKIIVDKDNLTFYDDGNCCVNKNTKTLTFGCKNSRIPKDIKSIGDTAFYKCTGLSTVILYEGIETIGDYAFYGCGLIGELNFPTSVSKIGNYAFYGCDKLTNVNFNNGEVEMTIGGNAFTGCTRITSFEIPKRVILIGSKAFDLRYVESFNVDDENKNYKNDEYYNLLSKDGTTLHYGVSTNISNDVTRINDNGYYYSKLNGEFTIPNNITEIGSDAFGYSSFSKIIFHENIETIGTSPFGYSQVEKVVLPDKFIKNIPTSFFRYSKLKSFNSDKDGVFMIDSKIKSIGSYAFYWMTGTVNFELIIDSPELTIGADAFYFTSELKTITIKCDLADDAISGSSPFYYDVNTLNYSDMCTKAIRVYATSVKTVNFGTNVTTINASAFSGYSKLNNVTIPSTVTSIGSSAFKGCTGLVTITYNSTANVSSNLFESCTALNKIVIPNGVTSIDSYAFKGCTKLGYGATLTNFNTITLPNTIVSIGSYAFNGCTSLSYIKYNGTLSDWEGINFGVNWRDKSRELTIICTDGNKVYEVQ